MLAFLAMPCQRRCATLLPIPPIRSSLLETNSSSTTRRLTSISDLSCPRVLNNAGSVVGGGICAWQGGYAAPAVQRRTRVGSDCGAHSDVLSLITRCNRGMVHESPPLPVRGTLGDPDRPWPQSYLSKSLHASAYVSVLLTRGPFFSVHRAGTRPGLINAPASRTGVQRVTLAFATVCLIALSHS